MKQLPVYKAIDGEITNINLEFENNKGYTFSLPIYLEGSHVITVQVPRSFSRSFLDSLNNTYNCNKYNNMTKQDKIALAEQMNISVHELNKIFAESNEVDVLKDNVSKNKPDA